MTEYGLLTELGHERREIRGKQEKGEARGQERNQETLWQKVWKCADRYGAGEVAESFMSNSAERERACVPSLDLVI